MDHQSDASDFKLEAKKSYFNAPGVLFSEGPKIVSSVLGLTGENKSRNPSLVRLCGGSDVSRGVCGACISHCLALGPQPSRSRTAFDCGSLRGFVDQRVDTEDDEDDNISMDRIDFLSRDFNTSGTSLATRISRAGITSAFGTLNAARRRMGSVENIFGGGNISNNSDMELDEIARLTIEKVRSTFELQQPSCHSISVPPPSA